MGKTAIKWATDTWNPTTGCDRLSPGCALCYAVPQAARNQRMIRAVGKHVEPTDPYMRDGDPKTSGPGFGFQMHEGRLDMPLRQKRARTYFVNSMSDLFHPEVTDDFLDRVFAVMALAAQHTFQVLTKRPERMREYMAEPLRARFVNDAGERIADENANAAGRWPKWANHAFPFAWPLPNVWLGTSVENGRWRTRIDELREIPAAVRFLSCEPLLGPLICPQCGGAGWDVAPDPRDPTGQTATQIACPGPAGWHGPHDLNLTGIDWVIVGGESGRGARPMDEQWVRSILLDCAEKDVAPFVKQMGEAWSREHLGHGGHAGEPEEWPADLRIREMPA